MGQREPLKLNLINLPTTIVGCVLSPSYIPLMGWELMPPSLTLILCKLSMSIKRIRERVSLKRQIVIILIIGLSKLLGFLRGKHWVWSIYGSGDTYYALRGHLPSNVAPGFDSFPLSSSAIRENNKNKTGRPLFRASLGIYLGYGFLQGLDDVT